MTDISTSKTGVPALRAAQVHAPGKRSHRAKIEHRIPGRIRMNVPSAKHNPALLEAYTTAFSAIPGVIKVDPRPATGSIVIHYDPKRETLFHDQLHDHCARHDTSVHEERPDDEIEEMVHKIENEAEFLAQRSELAKVTVDFFKAFDRELKTITDNTVDLKIVLAGGLAAFTFLEIGAEAATPMWVTLALFSLNHFVELQSAHHPVPGPATGAAPRS